MTEDDKRLEIGRLVEERQKVRGSLVCVERQLRRIRLALDRTQLAIDGHADYLLDDASGKLTISGVPHIQGCEESGEHPDGREIARLRDERRALKQRLDDIKREGAHLGL